MRRHEVNRRPCAVRAEADGRCLDMNDERLIAWDVAERPRAGRRGAVGAGRDDAGRDASAVGRREREINRAVPGTGLAHAGRPATVAAFCERSDGHSTDYGQWRCAARLGADK